MNEFYYMCDWLVNLEIDSDFVANQLEKYGLSISFVGSKRNQHGDTLFEFIIKAPSKQDVETFIAESWSQFQLNNLYTTSPELFPQGIVWSTTKGTQDDLWSKIAFLRSLYYRSLRIKSIVRNYSHILTIFYHDWINDPNLAAERNQLLSLGWRIFYVDLPHNSKLIKHRFFLITDIGVPVSEYIRDISPKLGLSNWREIDELPNIWARPSDFLRY